MTKVQKILIIEHQESLLNTLKLIVETQGYTVITAQDSELGIKLADQEQPDCIILDQDLPKTTGEVVIQLLAKNSKTTNIPIILLISNHVMPGGIQLVPLTPYKVAKPIKPQILLDILTKIN